MLEALYKAIRKDTPAQEIAIGGRAYTTGNVHGPSCDNETEADAAWNSLPRALPWTTEPPTVPGNYWWKCEHENPDAPQMVNVTITDEQFHFFFHYSEGPCLHSCGKCRWAGPIPMPQEPTT